MRDRSGFPVAHDHTFTFAPRRAVKRYTGEIALRRILKALLIACAAAVAPATAAAIPTFDGTFTPSAQPGHIATGPDGAVWFLLPGGATAKDFGRIAPDGTIEEFDTPNNVVPSDITAGPDTAGGATSRIWISYSGGVVKINPATPAAGTDFLIPTINGAKDIAPDRDGNLWVVDADGLVKVAPTGLKIDDVPVAGSGGRDIVLGGDGRMWWADFTQQAIEATQTAGPAPYVTTQVAQNLGDGPQGIAAGPAGQVAFGLPSNRLGRLSAGSAPLITTDTGSDAGFGIVPGGDGAYWATRFASRSLGRLTPAGAYTTPIVLPAGSGPRNIAAGANNTLWVTLETTNQIARISGVTAPAGNPAPAPAPVASADKVKPRLSALKVNAAKRRLSVRVTEAATLRLTIERRAAGRRKGKRCLASKKGRKGRRCPRYVRVRSLRKPIKAGKNTVSLGPKLVSGRYRVSLVAVDKAGNRSATARRAFTVRKAKKARGPRRGR